MSWARRLCTPIRPPNSCAMWLVCAGVQALLCKARVVAQFWEWGLAAQAQAQAVLTPTHGKDQASDFTHATHRGRRPMLGCSSHPPAGPGAPRPVLAMCGHDRPTPSVGDLRGSVTMQHRRRAWTRGSKPSTLPWDCCSRHRAPRGGVGKGRWRSGVGRPWTWRQS